VKGIKKKEKEKEKKKKKKNKKKKKKKKKKKQSKRFLGGHRGSPEPSLVVEWRNVSKFDCRGDSTANVTFDVVFSESSIPQNRNSISLTRTPVLRGGPVRFDRLLSSVSK